MKRVLTILLLGLMATPSCAFVEDLVRDPVSTAFDTIPFADDAVAYAIDGAFNVAVLSLVVLAGDEFEGRPRWICLTTCGADEEAPNLRVGHLSCANCETEEGVYIATGSVAVVVGEGEWRIAEFTDNDSAAIAATFESSGDTSWTWTDGTQVRHQEVFVRDAMDIAAFDVATSTEIDRVELAVGESLDVELLAVDGEGHILASTYRDVSLASAIAVSERLSFADVEAWDDDGTIARITGTAAGESTFVVRCAGVERSFDIVVR